MTSLSSLVESSAPLRGSYLPPSPFATLPLSNYTLSALKANGWTEQTKIQSAAIPHALAGRDVLGAAKTGR